MYYVLCTDHEYSVFAKMTYSESNPEYFWRDGAKISLPENPGLSLQDRPEKLPDYFESIEAPIVSQDFVAALEETGVENFDITPLVVEGYCEVKQFYAFNIVGCVHAMDEDESEFTLGEGDDSTSPPVETLKKLVLRPEACRDFDLFRLEEFSALIIVSKRLAKNLGMLHGLKLLKL